MTRVSKARHSAVRHVARGCLGLLLLGGVALQPAYAQTASGQAPSAAGQPGSSQPGSGQAEQAPNTATLTLNVAGLQSDEGVVLWTLYNSQASFEAFDPDTATAKGKCEIVQLSCTVSIENIPFGEYAILLAHDVDGDGEINRNPLSDELKGVSNYTSKLWWKPNWDDARFVINQPAVAITITVY